MGIATMLLNRRATGIVSGVTAEIGDRLSQRSTGQLASYGRHHPKSQTNEKILPQNTLFIFITASYIAGWTLIRIKIYNINPNKRRNTNENGDTDSLGSFCNAVLLTGLSVIVANTIVCISLN
jgi:hypothetical protein